MNDQEVQKSKKKNKAKKKPEKWQVDPVLYRARLLMRTKKFVEMVSEFRKRRKIPEYGFEKQHDYEDWLRISKNAEHVFAQIEEIAKEFNLTFNYYAFVQEYIGMGYRDSEAREVSRMNVYVGNGLLRKQHLAFNRAFIEIYPETTKEDIDKFFKKYKTRKYDRNNIESLRLRAFGRLETKYKVPSDHERQLRLYELKQQRKKPATIAKILNQEFSEFPPLYAYQINKHYTALKKTVKPPKSRI